MGAQQNELACLDKIRDHTFESAGDFCEDATVRWLYNEVVHMPMYYDLGLTDLDLDSITMSMGSWLNSHHVKRALHTTGHAWVNNDEVGPVAEALRSDFRIESTPLIADAVEKGYRVALYNGVRDGSVCNHLGNIAALLEMDKIWKFRGQFAAVDESPMWFQASPAQKQRVAGFHRILNAFSFTKFLNAGHLVPTVVPEEFSAYIDWVTKYVVREPAD